MAQNLLRMRAVASALDVPLARAYELARFLGSYELGGRFGLIRNAYSNSSRPAGRP